MYNLCGMPAQLYRNDRPTCAELMLNSGGEAALAWRNMHLPDFLFAKDIIRYQLNMKTPHQFEAEFSQNATE